MFNVYQFLVTIFLALLSAINGFILQSPNVPPIDVPPVKEDVNITNKDIYSVTTISPDVDPYVIKRKIDIVPEGILNQIVSKGWTVVFTSDELTLITDDIEVDENQTVLGYTQYAEKKITINANNANAFAHEVGHFIDCEFGAPSGTSSFETVYGLEVTDYCAAYYPLLLLSSVVPHNVGNASEYFADAFRAYCENPEKLKNKCPQTYDYIVDTINNVVNA